MKVCVVGATGVLGRALVPLLLERGDRVCALVRDPAKISPAANIEAVRCDLLSADDARKLPDMLSGCEAVLHIATAIPRDPTMPGAWTTNTRLRTEGTPRLLGAALTARATYYVQQSIIMAYPDGGDHWLDEDTPLDTSPGREGITAPVRTMEGMVRAVDPRRLGWCILRGGAFVGPGTAQDQMIEGLRRGIEVVPCDGRNFISPIHVADMATAIVAVLDRLPASAIFNIVDEPLRQGEYLDRLASIVGAATAPRRPDLPCPPSWRCSNHAAQTSLGWTPTHRIWPGKDQ